MLRALVAFAAFGSIALSGCSDSCLPMSVSGLGVRLRDAEGRAVCGTVTVRSGDYAETLVESGRARFDCVYSGLQDRGGRYAVTATAPGYKQVDTTVDIAVGSCGVEKPASITLNMERK